MQHFRTVTEGAKLPVFFRELANKIDPESRGLCCPAGVYDANGNKVGSVTLTGKDREL